jgi:hypothetical protein
MAHIRITVALCVDLEVENVVETSVHEEVVESMSVHESSGSGHNNNRGDDDGGSDEVVDAAAAIDDAIRTYYFGASTVTINHIREMATLKYFAEGDGRVPGEETIPKPRDDEVVVFENFFIAALRMPPHTTVAEMLLKFRVQLHQLMPNAIAQLSKYF